MLCKCKHALIKHIVQTYPLNSLTTVFTQLSFFTGKKNNPGVTDKMEDMVENKEIPVVACHVLLC